jgi:hypothetical protein
MVLIISALSFVVGLVVGALLHMLAPVIREGIAYRRRQKEARDEFYEEAITTPETAKLIGEGKARNSHKKLVG